MLVTYVNFIPEIVQLEDVLNRIAEVTTEACRCVADTDAFVGPSYLMSP